MIGIIKTFCEHMAAELADYRPDGPPTQTNFEYKFSDFESRPKSRYFSVRYTGNYEINNRPRFATRSDLVDLPEKGDNFEFCLKCIFTLHDDGDGGERFYNGIMETQLKLATMLDKAIGFMPGFRAMLRKDTGRANKFTAYFPGDTTKMNTEFNDVYELDIIWNDTADNVKNRTNEKPITT